MRALRSSNGGDLTEVFFENPCGPPIELAIRRYLARLQLTTGVGHLHEVQRKLIGTQLSFRNSSLRTQQKRLRVRFDNHLAPTLQCRIDEQRPQRRLTGGVQVQLRLFNDMEERA